jgi:hypothetical protein
LTSDHTFTQQDFALLQLAEQFSRVELDVAAVAIRKQQVPVGVPGGVRKAEEAVLVNICGL